MTTEGLPLPPLPEPSYLGDDASWGYDENDMREYAAQAIKAARAAERERCAKVCEQHASGAMTVAAETDDELASTMLRQVSVLGSSACAAAIRAMED